MRFGQITSCRACGGGLQISFCDLGSTPLANSYLPLDRAKEPDPAFPLHAKVCDRCFLVQLDYIVDPSTIFRNYAYFSSVSSSWVAHAEAFAKAAISRLDLQPNHLVVEIASNDGYLLQHFAKAGIRCLGIEPAENVARVAREAGIPTDAVFFSSETAKQLKSQYGEPALIVANNVLAHVPDINDFVVGLAHLAGSRGLVVIEVPHLLELVKHVQFDTIYHEHYSYWSLNSLISTLKRHGLSVIDVDQLATHGGSLRVYARAHPTTEAASVETLLQLENTGGMLTPEYYQGFSPRVEKIITEFRAYLERISKEGRTLAGYGAAAKGNTFLNAARTGPREVLFVADRSPAKQNTLLPGSRIPVLDPKAIMEHRPDDVLVLPWNILDEIAKELSYVSLWGGRLVTAIPQMRFRAG